MAERWVRGQLPRCPHGSTRTLRSGGGACGARPLGPPDEDVGGGVMGWMPRDPGSIGVAALGAGRMGRTHLATLGGIGQVRVISVVDEDPAAAEGGRAIARAEVAL